MEEWRRLLLGAAMQSEGALTFGDLWGAPLPEVVSIIEALGYVLSRRASQVAQEVARVEASRSRRRR